MGDIQKIDPWNISMGDMQKIDPWKTSMGDIQKIDPWKISMDDIQKKLDPWKISMGNMQKKIDPWKISMGDIQKEPISRRVSFPPTLSATLQPESHSTSESSDQECCVVGRRDKVCLAETECVCASPVLTWQEGTLQEVACLLGQDTASVKHSINRKPWGEVAGIYNLMKMAAQHNFSTEVDEPLQEDVLLPGSERNSLNTTI